MCCGPVYGQELSEEHAKKVAQAFFNNKVEYGVTRSQSYRSKDLDVAYSTQCMKMVVESGGGAFALVGGSDDEARVIGYGTTDGETMPDALENLLRVNPAPLSGVATNVAWARECGYSLPVEPILNCIRSQYAPFNGSCPYYIFDDGKVHTERCLVGCVATATEMVVSHYKYPRALLDSIEGFETKNVGVIPTIDAGTRLYFENILDVYDDGEYSEAQAKAVADLSYYLGVACEMNWGPSSSGANLRKLVEPMKRAFGYGYVRRLGCYDYSPRRWFELLMNELTNGRPIVYAGYTTFGGGHAFVLDGIDGDGYFHVNWGYGGDYDGYFDLSVFTPQERAKEPTLEGTIAGLNHMQEALFLYPDSVEYVTNDTLTQEHRIEVDTIVFDRNPDTNAYVTARIKVRNVSAEDVYSPVELFTYTELDSVGYPMDIDYLGVADAVVKAGCDTTLIAYLAFSEMGERLLGLNLPDSMYLPFDTVEVKKAWQPSLAFELTKEQIDSDKASFGVKITNKSAAYWSGRMVTYSIFEGDYTEDEGDWRHFTVLNLAPGGEMDDEVSFGELKPNTNYTFVVRNPWLPALKYAFVTSDPTGVENIEVNSEKSLKYHPTYWLNHRIKIEYDERTGNYRQVLFH